MGLDDGAKMGGEGQARDDAAAMGGGPAPDGGTEADGKGPAPDVRLRTDGGASALGAGALAMRGSVAVAAISRLRAWFNLCAITRFASWAARAYKSSRTGRGFASFLGKAPTSHLSVTYRAAAAVFSLADRLAGRAHAAIAPSAGRSALYRAAVRVKGIPRRRAALLLAAATLSAVCLAIAFPQLKAVSVLAVVGACCVVFLVEYPLATLLVAQYSIIYYAVTAFVRIPLLEAVWSELLLFGCVAVWLYKWLVHRRDVPYVFTPVDIPLMLFVAVCTFYLFANSPDIYIGLKGYRAVVEYMLFFFVITQLARERRYIKGLAHSIVGAGFVAAAIGVFQYFHGVDTPASWTDRAEDTVAPRVFSVAGNPNILAVLMLCVIPITVSIVLYNKDLRARVAAGFMAVVMTMCMVFTGSRSAWIALAIALAIFAFMMGDKRVVMVFAIVAVAVYFGIPSVQQRISYLISDDFINSSLRAGRLMRWPAAVEMVRENPLAGVGLGRFGGAVAAANRMPFTFYIDNYYLKIAVEMGLPGLASFLALMAGLLVSGFRAVRRLVGTEYYGLALGAMCSIVGVLATNVVLNNFDAPMVTAYFWVLAGMVMFLGYGPERAERPLPL